MVENRFLEAARRIAPTVAGLRDRFDVDRELPEVLVDGLRAAGLFRMLVPRAIGGAELPPIDFLAVVEELGRQDGSVGWCTAIAAGSARVAGALDQDVARTVFGSGDRVLVGALFPSGRATTVEGGYHVSGRWSYGSFIGHADWVGGGCVRAGRPMVFLCPRANVEVIDVWDVTGLRATGSHDYRVENLFVPENFTVLLVDYQLPARRQEPLYAMPMTSLLFASIAAVALGIARAALDELVELAATRRSGGSTAALRDRPLAQIDLAHAEALLGSARAYLFETVGRTWREVVAGRQVGIGDRAKVKLAACHAARSAIHAVDLAYQSAGGAALRYGTRLERCFRDVHAAGQHAMLGRQSTLEPVGRVLFGLSPNPTPL